MTFSRSNANELKFALTRTFRGSNMRTTKYICEVTPTDYMYVKERDTENDRTTIFRCLSSTGDICASVYLSPKALKHLRDKLTMRLQELGWEDDESEEEVVLP